MKVRPPEHPSTELRYRDAAYADPEQLEREPARRHRHLDDRLERPEVLGRHPRIDRLDGGTDGSGNRIRG